MRPFQPFQVAIRPHKAKNCENWKTRLDQAGDAGNEGGRVAALRLFLAADVK